MSGAIGRLREKFHSAFAEPAVSNSETPLCTTCAALDFKKLFYDGLSQAKAVPLGTFLDITQRSDRCSFCRLLIGLIRRRWRLDDFPHADVLGTNFSMSADISGSLISNLDKRKQMHRLFIHATRPYEITIALIATKADLHMSIQLLEEDARRLGRSRDFHGRRVEDEVNVRLIRDWLKLCERAHGDACGALSWKSGQEDLPEFVRMVDVIRMSLVRAGRNCRYVALSYVWGGSGEDYWSSTANAGARNRPSGFEESVLPATIIDAIQLTRQIGERYLWIDALCIIQDSQEDKAAQISIMDRVYGRAALTIIAATGASVRSGLAGIGNGSRTVDQHIGCVQGLHISIPLPSLAEAATDSTWSTRGWTFQEALLSRRRLYFTKHQVYFQCEKDVWCEDLVTGSNPEQGASNPMRYSRYELAPLVAYKTTSMNFRAYQEAIEQYSGRHLTVDTDILAAITALTNAMTRVLEPSGSNPKEAFRFGMWIRNLDISLLWHPRFDMAHTRRVAPGTVHSPWPSWAWSGWKGAVHYGIESFMLDGVDGDRHPDPAESLISMWHLVDEDGGVVRLDVRRIRPTWCVDDGADWHVPPYKYIIARQGNPSEAIPILDLSPPSGTLVFRTGCTRFRVVRMNADWPCAAHALFHLVLADVDGNDSASPGHAGRVVLPASTPSPSVFEFVVLSRCSGPSGLWDETTWGERYYGCLLHVLAVQNTRDDGRVSERVGLGVVVESAWMASGATERMVLLA